MQTAAPRADRLAGGLLSFPYVISETGVVLGLLLGLGLALLMAVTAEMVAAVTRAPFLLHRHCIRADNGHRECPREARRTRE